MAEAGGMHMYRASGQCVTGSSLSVFMFWLYREVLSDSRCSRSSTPDEERLCCNSMRNLRKRWARVSVGIQMLMTGR